MTIIERQLSEALRQLRKSTGMDWEKVIALRAKFLEEGGTREVCPVCKGCGQTEVDKWARVNFGAEPETCPECLGVGEVYVPRKEGT